MLIAKPDQDITKTQKPRKLQINFPHEQRCKNSLNFRKLNQTIYNIESITHHDQKEFSIGIQIF